MAGLWRLVPDRPAKFHRGLVFRMRSRRKVSYAETISTVSRGVLKLFVYFEKQQRMKTVLILR